MRGEDYRLVCCALTNRNLMEKKKQKTRNTLSNVARCASGWARTNDPLINRVTFVKGLQISDLFLMILFSRPSFNKLLESIYEIELLIPQTLVLNILIS